jgi:hypothetical protein
MNKLIVISYQINKLKNSVKIRGWFIFAGFGLSLLINLATWALIYFRLFTIVKDATSVPLHYNVYFGIDWIGTPIDVFVLPLIGSAVFLVNFILAYIINVRERLMGYVVIISTIIIQLFILLASLFVVLINL